MKRNPFTKDLKKEKENQPHCISTLTVKLHRTEKGKKCENGIGHNVSSTMNSGFPAGHRGTLVTLETERADKSQFNKGSNKNTSRLDCVTLQ